MEPGRPACWGPHKENWGDTADALALGGFRSSISGVRGARGLQVKPDVNSLEVSPLSGAWGTSRGRLGAPAGGRRGSPGRPAGNHSPGLASMADG